MCVGGQSREGQSHSVKNTNPVVLSSVSLTAAVTSSVTHPGRLTAVGLSHGVAALQWVYIHLLVRGFSVCPPVLGGLVRAGGGGRVRVFCVVFVWGHRLATFNAFPLHPSVLEPHFDLGMKSNRYLLP